MGDSAGSKITQQLMGAETSCLEAAHGHEYLDCFMGMTVSWSPTCARTYIPRLFSGPQCFTVSTHCTYTEAAEGISTFDVALVD